MRLITLIILLVGYQVTWGQENYIELNFKVNDEKTGEKLIGAYVDIYQDDVFFDSDTAEFWGHFKAFDLPLGKTYRFYIKKEGYVTKMGTVNANHKHPGDLQSKTPFICEVSLFEACGQNFNFLMNEPMIEMYLNPMGIQSWNQEHAESMLKKVDSTKYAGLTGDDKTVYWEKIESGKSMMSEGKYQEAIQEFEKANEHFECGIGVRLANDCEKKAKQDENIKELLVKADAAFDTNKYDEAVSLYQEVVTIRKDHTYANERLKEIEVILNFGKQSEQRYNTCVANADKHFEKKEWSEAKNWYEQATEILPEEKYPQDQLDRIYRILKSDSQR